MPMDTINIRAYTQTYGCLTNKIITNVIVFTDESKQENVPAQWDTGASATTISLALAQKMGLVSIGKAKMGTPAGVRIADLYLVNLKLPNGMIVSNIKVADSEIHLQGIDILIGMDVICRGDFVITNVKNKTVFSFVTPSLKKIDYVEAINAIKTKAK